MANLKDLVKKYSNAINQLNEERVKFALIIAHDAHSLTAMRVQQKGISAEGNKLSSYSKKPIKWWLLNPADYPSANKINKFKKDAGKETAKAKKENREPNPDKVSYYGLRKAYGLRVDIKNLTFTEKMFASIVQEVTKETPVSVEVTIKANNEDEQKKVNINSKREKTNILALSKEERAMVTEANIKRIEKVLR